MRKRLSWTVALIGATALAASAVPAFTADNGSVVATVSVAPPPAPCIMLTPGSIGFGTLPFSDPAAASTPLQDASPQVHFTSCATAGENLFLAASDATTASGGSWDVPNFGNDNTCTSGSNLYQPYFASFAFGSGRLYNPAADGTYFTRVGAFSAGQAADLKFQINMPCRGSAGAGEIVSMTFSALAVLV
jgi:hypothetical protein